MSNKWDGMSFANINSFATFEEEEDDDDELQVMVVITNDAAC